MGDKKITTKFSLKDISEYKKRLENYPDDLQKVAENIVRRLADEMLGYVLMNGHAVHSDKNPYGYSKRLQTRRFKSKVVGGIYDPSEISAFFEFGTGVMSSSDAHPNEWLEAYGWKLNKGGHDEQGWFYPTDESDPNPYKHTYDGKLYAWTRGLEPQMIYYKALELAKERFAKIAKEELEKGMK